MSLLAPAFETRASIGSTIGLNEKGDPALSSFFGGSSNTASSQVVNATTAMKISTVYACVNRKALTLAMLPLHVMRKLEKDGHEIASNFRLYRQLYSRPNQWQTSFEWRCMGQAHKMLRGNFYNYIQYNPGRKINELIPLHPDRVWPFVKTPSGAIYYMYEDSPTPPIGSELFYQYFPFNAEMIIFKADEVLHIKGISDNGIVGKRVVKLMAESVGLAMATEQQGATLFTNGAQIGKVFKHPNKLDDPAFDRLRAQLDQYTGASNAHRTIILENGMDISKISLTMEEAQFLDTRNFQVEDICSFLDVPMMLIHRSGDKNQTYASAGVIMQMFITLNMQPEFRNWEERLNEDLLFDSEKNNYYFKFDFDDFMRGDAAARAAYYKVRFDTASLKPNDIKRMEGESPYTDLPECDTVYVTPGVTTAKVAGEQKVSEPVKPVESKQVIDPKVKYEVE